MKDEGTALIGAGQGEPRDEQEKPEHDHGAGTEHEERVGRGGAQLASCASFALVARREARAWSCAARTADAPSWSYLPASSSTCASTSSDCPVIPLSAAANNVFDAFICETI